MPFDPSNSAVDPGRPVDYLQPLYDRVNLPTTLAGDIRFFSVPRGQSATLVIGTAATGTLVKTYRDTNLDTAGVASSKAYEIHGISVAYCVASIATSLMTQGIDRRQIREQGSLAFRIVDSDIIILPLICIPELNPIIGGMGAFSATTSQVFEVGGGGPSLGMYQLSPPIVIPPNRNFSVVCNFPSTVTLATSHDMYVILHAYQRRPGF